MRKTLTWSDTKIQKFPSRLVFRRFQQTTKSILREVAPFYFRITQWHPPNKQWPFPTEGVALHNRKKDAKGKWRSGRNELLFMTETSARRTTKRLTEIRSRKTKQRCVDWPPARGEGGGSRLLGLGGEENRLIAEVTSQALASLINTRVAVRRVTAPASSVQRQRRGRRSTHSLRGEPRPPPPGSIFGGGFFKQRGAKRRVRKTERIDPTCLSSGRWHGALDPFHCTNSITPCHLFNSITPIPLQCNLLHWLVECEPARAA